MGSEPDMGVDCNAAGEKFLENRRVFADEFDGAGGYHERFSVLSDDGNGEGLGRL